VVTEQATVTFPSNPRRAPNLLDSIRAVAISTGDDIGDIGLFYPCQSDNLSDDSVAVPSLDERRPARQHRHLVRYDQEGEPTQNKF
jgi:hypothetical protein